MPSVVSLPQKPWRDLRWWILILASGLILFWLLLCYGQARQLTEIVRVAVTLVAGMGIQKQIDRRKRR